MNIRVSIFEENVKIRNCIVSSLGMDASLNVVGSFSDINHYREKVLSSTPDVILMDMKIEGTETIDAVKILSTEFPDIKILIVTTFADDEQIFNVIYAGALGYILRDQLRNSLSFAIKEVVAGGAPMSPSIARKVLSFLQNGLYVSNKKASKDYHLTPREIDVLKAIVKGMSYKMVGNHLNISYETVRSHMKKIYEKLHVASLTEVVAKAINDNIV